MDRIPSTRIRPGIAMPLVGLGTWDARGDEAYRAVLRALEVGYRHIDTATMYRNEAQVGRALVDSGVPRDEVFVTSKLPPEAAGSERATLEATLAATGLDVLDLWLVHWPPGRRATPQTWERFLAAQRDGLVRAVGVSNYSIAQVDELTRATGVTPAVNQIPWGPSTYDAGQLAAHRERDVVVEGYSPFKNPGLRHPVLTAVAGEYGRTPAQVVVRWHLQHGVVAIPKSSDPERIAANIAVLDFALAEDAMARIDAIGG